MAKAICLPARAAHLMRRKGNVAWAMAKIGMLSASIALFATHNASAQPLEEHFHGKTMRLIWPGQPGGDRGQYAYPFMKHFVKHVPGKPTIVPVFMPGAGGATGINYLYGVAAPDGLTIATPLAPVVIAQATGDAAVKYDVRKMVWLGRISDATRILFVATRSGVTDIAGLRAKEMVVGSSGVVSETYINPAVMNNVLGTKFKIVTGYKAIAEVNLAPERGETDGAFSTWNNIKNIQAKQLEAGTIRILVQIADTIHRDLPKVPLLRDLATDDEARQVIDFMTSSSQMGQSYAAPPGVPAPIAAALRAAFDATMADPEFIAELKKGDIEFNPASGQELTKIVDKTMSVSKSAIAKYQAAVKVN